MPAISNTDIAYEAGETYAMEVQAGLSTASALIACPYDSEEMIKAFQDGFNKYMHDEVTARMEQACEEQEQMEDEAERNKHDEDLDDPDWDDNGLHQYPYERD